MKSIKYLPGIVLIFFVAVFFTSCSNSSGSNGVAPAITSANSTVLTEGAAGTFTVTATGNPTPTLTLTGTLPSGVTFVTGVLSGTPASGTNGTYSLTITASNGVYPDATQNFTLTVNPPPGSLDTSFGTGGIVTTSVGSNPAIALALGIQSDGKIVAAGQSYNGSHYVFTLVRYNVTDGSLDTTFSTGGIVTAPVGFSYALGIQSDGKLVAAGFSYYGIVPEFTVVRYWP